VNVIAAQLIGNERDKAHSHIINKTAKIRKSMQEYIFVNSFNLLILCQKLKLIVAITLQTELLFILHIHMSIYKRVIADFYNIS